jgi:outer membrane lipoprotein-sorting protein
MMVRVIRTSACLLAAVLAAAAAQAQTADEIVAKNLKAKGGVEKLKAMNSVKISGTISAQGMEMRMTTWAKRPNLTRREMTIQDKRVINGFDGSIVWAINPLATGSEEPQEVSGPTAQLMKDDSDFDGVLLDYKEKGHKVELVGTETLDGKKVHHLKITKKNGQVQDYYLDADSGMEVRTVMSISLGGAAMQVTTDLSNFQQVDGVTMPFTMKQTAKDTTKQPANEMVLAEVKIDKVEFNVPMDDSMFRMPGKK